MAKASNKGAGKKTGASSRKAKSKRETPSKRTKRGQKGVATGQRGKSRAAAAKGSKYEQSGAPWWKQHLPG